MPSVMIPGRINIGGDARTFLENDKDARAAFAMHSFDARAAWHTYYHRCGGDTKRFRTLAAWQRHRVRFTRFHRETASTLKLMGHGTDDANGADWCETPPSPCEAPGDAPGDADCDTRYDHVENVDDIENGYNAHDGYANDATRDYRKTDAKFIADRRRLETYRDSLPSTMSLGTEDFELLRTSIEGWTATDPALSDAHVKRARQILNVPPSLRIKFDENYALVVDVLIQTGHPHRRLAPLTKRIRVHRRPSAGADPSADAGPSADPSADAGPSADADPSADPSADAGPSADPMRSHPTKAKKKKTVSWMADRVVGRRSGCPSRAQHG